METVCDVTHSFEKRFKGEGTEDFPTGFVKEPDARFEKGLRGFHAMALLSVFSTWYTTVLVDLLHEEQEPIEWSSLHVGAERGINCENLQAL